MLKLTEINEGKKNILVTGDLDIIIKYLKDNEDIYNWVQSEDPEIELPNLNSIESIRDLQFELDKINLSWWELSVD